MFVTDQIMLEAGLPAAVSSLGRLTGGRLVLRAASHAYSEGLTELRQAGPVRYLPSSWGLAGVRLGELAVRDGCARLPMRWESTGPAGPFPVLDGDITLTAAGEEVTILTLTGTYRPLPALAADVDRQAVRRCAAATIGGFLARLGCAIAHPAGRSEPASLAS